MTDVLARIEARHARTGEVILDGVPYGRCAECRVSWPCRTWLDLESAEERDAREAANQAAHDAFMRDPIARIRAYVTGEGAYESYEQMAAAICAALEEHAPEGPHPCAVRHGETFQVVTFLPGSYCPTIKVMAGKLGIGVPDA